MIPPTAFHPCSVRHRSWAAVAKCRFHADRVSGDGTWAFIHTFYVRGYRNPHTVHVHLYDTLADAQAGAAMKVPCSGTCVGHLVRNLEGV